MKVEIIALCDAATESGGKLNILGAFDTIYTQNTPLAHTACAVAVRIRFENSEQGTHTFRVVVIDQDGANTVPPLEGTMTTTIKPDFPSGTAHLVVNFQGLQLGHFGEYRIDFTLDNQLAATVPLFVRAMPGALASAPPR